MNANEAIKKTTIYFRLTSICNSDCEFCYRDSMGETGPDTSSAKKILDKIKKFGFKRISLIGGEIFLRPDIEEIIKYASENGFEVYISTNGSLIGNRFDFLNKYVSIVGLPLDGSSVNKSRKMRNVFDQFAITVDFLRKLKAKKPKFKVRISTVVSRINKNDLLKIGKLLFESNGLYRPDGWRLLIFLGLGEKAKENKDKFSISEKEFQKAIEEPMKKYPKVTTRSNSIYIFISPNSRVLLSRKNKYTDLGDFNKI